MGSLVIACGEPLPTGSQPDTDRAGIRADAPLAQGAGAEGSQRNRKALDDAQERSRRELERGRALAAQGEMEAARQAFENAVALDGNSHGAHFYLGTALTLLSHVTGGHAEPGTASEGELQTGAPVSLGRNDRLLSEGILSLRRAVDLAPDREDYLFELGRVLHVGGDNEESIEVLLRLLRANPGHGAAQKRLGLVHLDDGDLDAAARALRVAEGLLPEDPGVPYQLGNALLEEHPEEARDAFRRSLAIDPTFPSPQHGLVGVLSRLGDSEGAQRAKEDFERWRRFQDKVARAERRAKKRPTDVPSQLAVADLYAGKGRWARAAESYGLALVLDPKHATAHFQMGRMALALGEHESARNHLEEALFLTPAALEPRIELVRLCSIQGDLPRREELLGEIRRAQASLSADGRLLFAEALIELGLADEARTQCLAVPVEAAEYDRAQGLLLKLEGTPRDAVETNGEGA